VGTHGQCHHLVMDGLVSILIPAYNAGQWLAETLRSALAQTWPRKEIIVVDDGSTDRTLEVARSFASMGVLVVSHQNQGAAASRNKAFSLCRGDYIQWLDADDLLSPDKVAKQMEAVARGCGKRTLLSSAWGAFMYRPLRAQFQPTGLWCDLSPAEFLVRKLGQNLHMQTATWLVSRELTEAAGPWNTQLATDDDGEYFCRVLLASDGVRFISEASVLYRIVGSQRLSYIGRSPRKMESQLHSMRLHIGYLLSLEDSERARAACVTYLQNWLGSFYPERTDLAKQAEQLARELGRELHSPRLSWKYDWIRRRLGWRAAKSMQALLVGSKWLLLRWWDSVLFRLERRTATSRGLRVPER
jgi:glycosyltransferase involved in cell wall biosynthesis